MITVPYPRCFRPKDGGGRPICAPLLGPRCKVVGGAGTFSLQPPDPGRARAVGNHGTGQWTRYASSNFASAPKGFGHRQPFPDRADPAVVRELHRSDPVTSVAISGDCRWASWIFTPTSLSDPPDRPAGCGPRNARGPRSTRTLFPSPPLLSPCSTATGRDTRRLGCRHRAQNIRPAPLALGGAGRGPDPCASPQ